MPSQKAHRQKPEHSIKELFDLDLNALPNDPMIDEIVNGHLQELAASLPRKQRERLPGAAIAVRKGDQLVHLNCYGYANLETGARITPNTIFDLGSLSKQFTALAVLDLVNRDRVRLEDPISKFFKGFPRYADEITVEDLIHHTSSLPEYIDIYVQSRRAEKDWYKAAMERADEWYPRMTAGKKEIASKDVLNWIATQTLLPQPPDTEFDYCNSGYVMLAQLVEAVTKKRFAAHLKKRLFDPFGMIDTYVFDEASKFSKNDPEVANHAKCYNRISGQGFVPIGYTPMNFIVGDGNVHSNIVDVAIWESLLNEIDDLLTQKETEGIRETLWRPAKLKSRRRVDYGWGWYLLSDKYTVKTRGKGVVKYESRAEYHRGTWLAWRCYIARGSRWIVPKPGKSIDPKTLESLGIIVLSNNNQFRTCRIAQDISRIYWGPLKKDNIMNNFNCG